MTSVRIAPVLLLVACGHERPGLVEARNFLYSDNSGLTVATTAASVDQRVARHVSIYARAVADYIHVVHKQLDPSDPTLSQVLTGHRDADVVTSASALPSGGGSTDKWRAEVAAGPTLDGTLRGNPASLGAVVRTSFEPDYRSYSGVLRGSIGLFQQNTTLGAFVGYGYDQIIPDIAPAGQAALWPGSHQRWTGGVTLTQLLSARLVLSLGIAGSRQEGQLASPYRRAIVKTTLFPESVPSVRGRGTAFAGVSAYLTRETVLHLRLGGYLDSWGIGAVIPEVAISKLFGTRWLAHLQYRFYEQTAARFYQPVYQQIEDIMSGDPRDGIVQAHTLGIGGQFLAMNDPLRRMTATVVAAYDFTVMDYVLLGQRIFAHVATLGLNLSY